MKYNPRNTALALGTAAALLLGTAACGAQEVEKVETPRYTVPDCDLGDIEEGDSDCDNPAARIKAVEKYGKTKVEAAHRKYLDKKARKAREEANKRVNKYTAPATKAGPTPKATSTKDSLKDRLFGDRKTKSSSRTGSLGGGKRK